VQARCQDLSGQDFFETYVSAIRASNSSSRSHTLPCTWFCCDLLGTTGDDDPPFIVLTETKSTITNQDNHYHIMLNILTCTTNVVCFSPTPTPAVILLASIEGKLGLCSLSTVSASVCASDLEDWRLSILLVVKSCQQVSFRNSTLARKLGFLDDVGVLRSCQCHLRAGFQQCKSFVEM
jgi:hypothetical protein